MSAQGFAATTETGKPKKQAGFCAELEAIACVIAIAGVAAVIMMAPGAALAHCHQVQPRRRQRYLRRKGRSNSRSSAEKYTNGKVKIGGLPELLALQATRKRSRRCSSARCRCWRPRSSPCSASRSSDALDLPWRTEATYTAAMKGKSASGCSRSWRPRASPASPYRQRLPHGGSSKLLDFEGLKFRISGSKIANDAMSDRFRRSWRSRKSTRPCRPGRGRGLREYTLVLRHRSSSRCRRTSPYPIMRICNMPLIVNSKFWERIAGRRSWPVDKAMSEATDYTNSIAVKENEDALAEIKKSGKTTLHYLTDDQRKAWQTAMQPTYKWAKGPGRAGRTRSRRQGTSHRDELTSAFDNNNKRAVGKSCAPGRFDIGRRANLGLIRVRALNRVLDHIEEWRSPPSSPPRPAGLIFIAVLTDGPVDRSLQMGGAHGVRALCSSSRVSIPGLPRSTCPGRRNLHLHVHLDGGYPARPMASATALSF